MNIAISLRDIDIAYGPTTIVDRLNIDIAEGEFVVLLGPSGCGKSTLLSAIAGLTDVSDGEIWIMGKNATWTEPKDRGIGMVFQSYALYPRMTVEENLSFGLRVAKVAKAEIAARVARAAAVLQLEPFLKRRPSDLSGGQRQRVAIGRALVRDVDIFLFDEPLSNLDAKLRAELRVEIKRLHQSLGNTMVYVTHDQIEAMTLADRIAIMRSGKIQQLGSPAEIYHRPANLFVAGFIGSPPMNFAAGALSAGAGRMSVTLAGVELDLGDYPFIAPPQTSQTVTVGFRPEHVVLNSAAGAPVLEATISVVEPMGADTIVWATLGDQTIGVRAPGDFAGKPGTAIALGFDVSKFSIFDGAGDRL